jgi:DNA-binding IclR family transcriptional regulator
MSTAQSISSSSVAVTPASSIASAVPQKLVAPVPPIGVLERGLAILECFREDRLRMSLRDFAELTGLDKATLLRLLGVLVNARMVQRSDSGQYTLGPATLHLGMLYRGSVDLGARLQPVLRSVMEKSGETVAFYVRSGEERVCLYREHTQSEMRPHVEPGTRLPLTAGGASAHVLLYFSGGKTAQAATIAKDGYVITRSERVPEMASIAVPVFDGDGSFAGSMVVMGLASRHSREAQLAALEGMREQLAQQGFAARPPKGWAPKEA